MSNEVLSLRVDSRGTQADLERLDKALLNAEQGFERLQRSAVGSVAGLDRSLSRASKSMGQFAQISQLISRMRGTENAARQITLFSQAVDQLGRAKMIRRDALKNFGDFIRLAGTASRVNFSSNTVKSLRGFVQVMNEVASARAVSRTKLENFGKIIMLVAQASKLRINNSASAGLARMAASLNKIGQVRGLTASKIRNITTFFEALRRFRGVPDMGRLERMFMVLGRIRVPSASAIGRLQNLFKVLSQSTGIPNAAKIARDLNQVAVAASRAANAIDRLPRSMRQLGARAGRQAKAFVESANGAKRMNDQLSRTPAATNRARRGIMSLNSSLTTMNTRLNLGYQAGTLFTTVFSAFTLGAFVREVYKVGIEVMKLEKAMLFATKSFEEGQEAVDEFLALANRLGLQIESIIEPYSRFIISATAANLELETASNIFESVSTALVVVGAGARQTELAFFGLTQMMQKGRVSSEEFNRQIGEQIPGNAVVGAMALSELEGRLVSVSELFERMRRGEIMSASFVPEYAEQLSEMFGPLLTVALRRPDVALNRLRNTFFDFLREVGESGFMEAIGDQFNRLNALFVDSEGELTETAESLAETLGQNMASGARLLVDVIEVLVNNIDTVINSLKLFLGLAVANTLKIWTTEALRFSAAMATMPVRMLGRIGGRGRRRGGDGDPVDAAEPQGMAPTDVALGAAMGAETASIVASRRERGGRAAGEAGRPVASATRGPSFGTRAAGAAAVSGSFDATARSGRKLNSILGRLGNGFKSVMRFIGGMITGIGALRLAMMALLGPIGLAVATIGGLVVGMQAISDKSTEVGGRTVEFGDITGAVFERLGNAFNSVKTGLGNLLASWGTSFDEMQAGAGDVIVNIIAGFETFFEKVMAIIQALGHAMGRWWEEAMGPFAEAMAAIGEGDFMGALRAMGENFNFQKRFDTIMEIIGESMEIAGDSDSMEDNRNQMRAAVFGQADDREAGERRININQQLDEERRRIQRQLQLADLVAEERRDVGAMETVLTLQADGGRRSLDSVLNDTRTILTGGEVQSESSRISDQARADVEERLENLGNVDPDAPIARLERNLERMRGISANLEERLQSEATPEELEELRARTRGQSPEDIQRDLERSRNAFASVQSVMMQGGTPADQALARLARAQEKIQDFNDVMQESLVDFLPEGEADQFANRLEEAMNRMRERAQEAIDPIGTALDRREDELEVLRMQADGQADLAQLQERINGLNQQGYEITLEGLGAKREEFLQQERTMRLLQEQVELQSQLNDLTVQRAELNQSPQQADFLRRVASMANDGESVDEALARLRETNPERLAMARRGAREQEDFRRESARTEIERELARMVEDARLSGTAETFRNDYRRILEEMTGLSGRSIAQLEAAASEADIALAERFAETKREIENPPGFQRWVDGLEPFEERLQDIKEGFADDLASTITDAIMGEDVDFSEMFERAQRRMVQGRVEQAMGNLFNRAQSANEQGGGFFQRVGNFFNPDGTAVDEQPKITEPSDGSDQGFFGRIGSGVSGVFNSLFGGGGQETEFDETPAAMETAATMSVKAQTVYVNAANMAGGGGGGAGGGGGGGLLGGIGQSVTSILNSGGQIGIPGPNRMSGAPDMPIPDLPSMDFLTAGLSSAGSSSPISVPASVRSGGGGGGGFDIGSAFQFGGDAGKAVLDVFTSGGGNGKSSGAKMALDAVTSGGGGAGFDLGAPFQFGGEAGKAALNAFSSGGEGGGMNFLQRGLSNVNSVFGGGGPNGNGLIARAKEMFGGDNGIGTLSTLAALGSIFTDTGGEEKDFGKEPEMPGGIIGEMSRNTMSGTEISAKKNPFAGLINFGLDLATGGQYSTYAGIGDAFGSIGASVFAEGGFSDSPVSRVMVPAATFANAPHFAEGTPNTDGAMPAMLHPDEAVIPLSRNRKVPVEMNERAGRPLNVSSNITIVAPDPDSFRMSEQSMLRKQNRDLRKAAHRNFA